MNLLIEISDAEHEQTSMKLLTSGTLIAGYKY